MKIEAKQNLWDKIPSEVREKILEKAKMTRLGERSNVTKLVNTK